MFDIRKFSKKRSFRKYANGKEIVLEFSKNFLNISHTLQVQSKNLLEEVQHQVKNEIQYHLVFQLQFHSNHLNNYQKIGIHVTLPIINRSKSSPKPSIYSGFIFNHFVIRSLGTYVADKFLITIPSSLISFLLVFFKKKIQN